MVRCIVKDQIGSFSLSEIAAQVPGVSMGMVKKTLLEMKSEGVVKTTGRGRGATWEVAGKT